MAERFPTINALVTSTTPSPRTLGYDSDSVDIAIDNCCTRTLTNNLGDMVKGSVKKIKPIRVKGIGGQFQYITHQGTIRWIVEDDQGVAHEILIQGSLYGATIGMRLANMKFSCARKETYVLAHHFINILSLSLID